MTTDVQAIFAKDLKPGMIVTPWSQGAREWVLELTLVSQPYWSHSSGEHAVKVAGWRLDATLQRERRDDSVLNVYDTFALLGQEDSDA